MTQNQDSSLLTVLIGCYSYEHFFEETLNSVLSQTIYNPRDIKILVYDNGSRPSYRDLIRKLALEHGFDVIRSEKNTYGQGSRIEAYPHIQSRYLAILHDDDCFSPDKLERSLKAISGNDLDYLITNLEFIDEKGRSYDKRKTTEVNFTPMRANESRGSLLYDIFWPGQRMHYSTLVMKTALAQATLLGDPFYPRIADSYFWAELLLRQELKFAILEDKLTKIRLHGANDRFTNKFSGKERAYEIFQHFQNEAVLFCHILNSASKEVLHDFADRLQIPPRHDEQLVTSLVNASIDISKLDVRLGKSQLAFALFHRAYKESPREACLQIQGKLGVDANTYTTQLYRGNFESYRINFLEFYPAVIRNFLVGSSASKLTLQWLFGSLIWVPAITLLKRLVSEERYLDLRDSWRKFRKPGHPQL